MAKITRTKNFIPFGGTATTTAQREVFDAAGGTFSNDFDTNQTPELEEGWSGVGDPATTPLVSNRATSAIYQTGRAVQILMQDGIINWVAAQKMYHPCSVLGSNGKQYISKDGSFDHTVNPVTDDGTNWVLSGDGNVNQDDFSTVDEEIMISDGTAKKIKGSGKSLAEYQELLDASVDIEVKSLTTDTINPSGAGITLGATNTTTQAVGDDTTKVATTEFVKTEITTEIQTLVDSMKTTGTVKINSGGGGTPLKPSVLLVVPDANTDSNTEQLVYTSSLNYGIEDFPSMVTSPTDADIYDFTNNTIIENNVLDQVNQWRFIFNVTKSDTNRDVTLIFRLYNTISGFELFQSIISVAKSTNPSNVITSMFTVSSNDSLPGGTGIGYNLEIHAVANNSVDVTVELDSLTRVSLYHEGSVGAS